MTTMTFFGDKLRSARKKAGYTQDQIAAELGMLRTNYNPYETGKKHPSPEILESISKLLGVDINVLRAWVRLDEVPVEERKAMILELIQTIPPSEQEKELYQQIVKYMFDSLPKELKIQMLGSAADYFRNELLQQEAEYQKKRSNI